MAQLFVGIDSVLYQADISGFGSRGDRREANARNAPALPYLLAWVVFNAHTSPGLSEISTMLATAFFSPACMRDRLAWLSEALLAAVTWYTHNLHAPPPVLALGRPEIPTPPFASPPDRKP